MSCDNPKYVLSLLSAYFSAHKRKPNVSLMPRVLAKKGGAEKVEGQPYDSGTTVTKMSNADFRKLLLKQWQLAWGTVVRAHVNE